MGSKLRAVWNVVGILLMLIGAIDIPGQIGRWSALIQQHDSLIRWGLVLVGLAIIWLASRWNPWWKRPTPPPQSEGPPPRGGVAVELENSRRNRFIDSDIDGGVRLNRSDENEFRNTPIRESQKSESPKPAVPPPPPSPRDAGSAAVTIIGGRSNTVSGTFEDCERAINIVDSQDNTVKDITVKNPGKQKKDGKEPPSR